MNISLSLLKKVLADSQLEIVCAADIIPEGKKKKLLKAGSRMDAKVLTDSEAAGIMEVPVRLDYQLLKPLCVHDQSFRSPYGVGHLPRLRERLALLETCNSRSKKRRTLHSAAEVYLTDVEPVFSFNQEITAKMLDRIPVKEQAALRVAYRYSELKILVLLDMRPNGADYSKRFYRNTELISALMGKKRPHSVVISPDLIPASDVHTVEDPKKLLSRYQETNARLIIVGDALIPEYTRALVEVKTFDPFARFMLAAKIDLTDLAAFLQTVSSNYHRPLNCA